MAFIIKDGTGHGYSARVGSSNRLWVFSKSSSLQHVIAVEEARAFQAQGTATLASGTVCVLHMKNTDTTRNMIVTYIRHQLIDPAGGTAFPNASNYFRIAFGRTYSSGGSSVTPVNTTSGSGVTSGVTVYDSAPTLSGTASEIDRWYTKAEADMNVYNKEGAVVIPPNKTLELAYVGDHTSGTVYARVSFFMEDIYE